MSKHRKCKSLKMKPFRESTQRMRDAVEWVEAYQHVPFAGNIESYEDCKKYLDDNPHETSVRTWRG